MIIKERSLVYAERIAALKEYTIKVGRKEPAFGTFPKRKISDWVSCDFILGDSCYNLLSLDNNSTHKIFGIGDIWNNNSVRGGFRKAPVKNSDGKGLKAIPYLHVNNKKVYQETMDGLIFIPKTLYSSLIKKIDDLNWYIKIDKIVEDELGMIRIEETHDKIVPIVIESKLGRWLYGPWVEPSSGPLDYDITIKMNVLY